MAPTDTYTRHANWISLIGAVLDTASALPAGFVFGLWLIPLGLWRTRRLARGESATFWPTIDLSAPRVRHIAIGVLALSGVNIATVALAATQCIEYVDSRSFCTGSGDGGRRDCEPTDRVLRQDIR